MSENERISAEEAAEIDANNARDLKMESEKVPTFSNSVDTGGRIPLADRGADMAAAKAWKEFEGEVKEWELTGGRNEIKEIREGFADYLTEKYMCQTLDGIASTQIVVKVRKDVIGVIERFVVGEDDQIIEGDAESLQSIRPGMKPGRRTRLGNNKKLKIEQSESVVKVKKVSLSVSLTLAAKAKAQSLCLERV